MNDDDKSFKPFFLFSFLFYFLPFPFFSFHLCSINLFSLGISWSYYHPVVFFFYCFNRIGWWKWWKMVWSLFEKLNFQGLHVQSHFAMVSKKLWFEFPMKSLEKLSSILTNPKAPTDLFVDVIDQQVGERNVANNKYSRLYSIRKKKCIVVFWRRTNCWMSNNCCFFPCWSIN